MKILIAILTFSLSIACSSVKKETLDELVVTPKKDLTGLDKAYFAMGCFWCVEAIFESVEGVAEVVSGYAEGKEETAKYELVGSGRTGHVEAIEIFYDAKVVDYATLVKVLFASGDPTTLNRQGPDGGYQYRSAIYYQNESEEKIAKDYKAQLEADKVYDDPIVVDIIPYTTFFDAEAYHQDFEKRNPNQGYVRAVSVPRLKRFQAKHPELLKKGHKG